MANKTRLINKFGTLTGWNEITVNIFGRDLEGIESVKYDDEQDISVAYGAGHMPIGKTRGNYSATAGITLYHEEIAAIQKQLPPGTRLQDIPDFDVAVVFEYQSTVYKDIIRNCSFKNNGRDVKSGDGKITKELELVCTHIDWNV